MTAYKGEAIDSDGEARVFRCRCGRHRRLVRLVRRLLRLGLTIAIRLLLIRRLSVSFELLQGRSKR